MGESQGEYACSDLYCPEGVLRGREIAQKFPFLEVWLNEFTTIRARIRGQQAIESYHGII